MLRVWLFSTTLCWGLQPVAGEGGMLLYCVIAYRSYTVLWYVVGTASVCGACPITTHPGNVFWGIALQGAHR